MRVCKSIVIGIALGLPALAQSDPFASRPSGPAEPAPAVRFDHGGGGVIEITAHAVAYAEPRAIADAAFYFPNGARPGAQGEAEVRVELLGGAVVPAERALALRCEPRSEAVTLGVPRLLDEAQPAAGARAFAGRSVHEGLAVFRVPVEIAPDAEAGAHEVRFTVDAELFDGARGTPAGLRRIGVRASLDVAAAPAAAAPVVAPPAAPARAAPIRALAPEPRRVSSEPPAAPLPALEPRSSGELRWLLLAGGLVLLASWVGWRARLSLTTPRGAPQR